MNKAYWGFAIVLGMSIGCTPNPPPRPTVLAEHRPDPTVLLASIRAEARALGENSVDVTPLSEPEREHWLERIRERIAAGDLRGAEMLAEQSLAEHPDAPDLLQEAAELALLVGDYQRAIRLAGKSYETGPRLGELCRRNWLTVVEARQALADDEWQETARTRLALCSPPGPVRM